MRSGTIAIAAGVALLLSHAGPATAAGSPAKSAAARIGESLPLGGAITNPDWVRRPSGDELANLFPKLAQLMQLSGSAVMDCTVNTSGEMEGCRIVSEAPLGLGFGYATLRSAKTFRMKPQMVDGAPVAGAKVTVPMRWQAWKVDDKRNPTPIEPTAIVPESRLALARSALKMSAVDYSTGMGKWIDQIIANATREENEAGAVTRPVERELALQSLRAAAIESGAQRTDQLARKVAARLSEAELTQVLAFFGGPAGKAWMSMRDDSSERELNQLPQDIFRKGGLRFCTKVTCVTDAPSTAKASGQP